MTLKPRRFPSGPGFDAYRYGEHIGSIGKHYRETMWWWQAVDEVVRRRGKWVTQHGGAGAASTKQEAAAALSAHVRSGEQF